MSDDVYDGDSDQVEHCEICGAEVIPYHDDLVECSGCGAPGCTRCLSSWDDIYEYLCEDCVAALTGDSPCDGKPTTSATPTASETPPGEQS